MSSPVSEPHPPTPRDVVAIDGPSGAGKSTVARRLAERLGRAYLDTGAMYRAVTWHLLRRGWDGTPGDARVGAWLDALQLDVDDGRVRVDGADVTAELRGRDIEARVSVVAALPAVRARLAELQREQARRRPIVAEGRDMGTHVFPAARHKFFVDASLAERARRRHRDFTAAGRAVDLETIQAEIAERDRYDSQREVAPLRAAEDAVRVDTTDRSIEEVVELLHAAVRAAPAEGRES